MGSVPYVPIYVYVRTYVCSPFVITLATSFIIQFRYNFIYKFAFQRDRVMVKVAVTIFGQNLSSL